MIVGVSCGACATLGFHLIIHENTTSNKDIDVSTVEVTMK